MKSVVQLKKRFAFQRFLEEDLQKNNRIHSGYEGSEKDRIEYGKQIIESSEVDDGTKRALAEKYNIPVDMPIPKLLQNMTTDSIKPLKIEKIDDDDPTILNEDGTFIDGKQKSIKESVQKPKSNEGWSFSITEFSQSILEMGKSILNSLEKSFLDGVKVIEDFFDVDLSFENIKQTLLDGFFSWFDWVSSFWGGIFDKAKNIFLEGVKVIEDFFGIDFLEIFKDVKEYVSSIFSVKKIKEKFSELMKSLENIGIPKMTVFEGLGPIPKIVVGPWYPFKQKEEKPVIENTKPDIKSSKLNEDGEFIDGERDKKSEILKEQKAYNQLGWLDKRKVDVGYTTAVELLKSIQSNESKNMTISNILQNKQEKNNEIKTEMNKGSQKSGDVYSTNNSGNTTNVSNNIFSSAGSPSKLFSN